MSAHLSDGRLDLVCDEAGCAAMFHGFNRHAGESDDEVEARVRGHAHGFGWRRFRRHGAWHDACADCVRAWARAGAKRAAGGTDEQNGQERLI